MGVEKLFHRVYEVGKYNKLVRPTVRNSSLTEVFTELKILQIDLVSLKRFFNFFTFLLKFETLI
jgi:hypothetical protein